MRLCKLAVALAAVVGLLFGLTPHASAGGGAAGRCETTNPSGAPISITIIRPATFTVIGQTVTLVDFAVTATFGNVTLGPFTAAGGQITGVLDTLDGACGVFNELGLTSQILTAFGLPGTSLDFTRCSFAGPASGTCRAPAGTIHSPAGYPTEITGYIGH